MNRLFGVFRYWDSSYDEELMGDRVAMNLLFLQVLSRILSLYCVRYLCWYLSSLRPCTKLARQDCNFMPFLRLVGCGICLCSQNIAVFDAC